MTMDRPRRKSKPRKTRLTQGQQERFLESPEGIRALDAEVRRQKRKALARDKKNLRRMVPSAPWFDAKWDHNESFPPGGDRSLMVCCNKCDRLTPPNCISSSGACEDCKLAAMSPGQLALLQSSASVVDMARLKANARAGRQYNGAI
jgi:hypothetical protein